MLDENEHSRKEEDQTATCLPARAVLTIVPVG